MAEYFTRGLVLDRNTRKEMDDTVTVYTKDLGKIIAYSKSTKKIESKLSSHLDIGRFVRLRVIKGNNYKIIDAISESIAFSRELLKFIRLVNNMTPYEAPDPHLWHGVEYTVKNGLLSDNSSVPLARVYRRFLEIFGYGAEFAHCTDCDRADVSHFYPHMIAFLCSDSLKKLKIDDEEVIKI